MQRSTVQIVKPTERKRKRDGLDNDAMTAREGEELTLEQRLELRKKKGTKAQHHRLESEPEFEHTEEDHKTHKETPAIQGRKDKNAPMEMPSNRPVSSYREVIDMPRRKRRDPRFEEVAGTLQGSKFRSVYKFLDDNAEQEIQTLQKQLKKEKNEQRRANIQRRFTRLKQQLREAQKSDRLREVKNKMKKEEEKKVESGKKPFYPKRKDVRELALIDRFDELKRKGPEALDKAIEKKRKKNRRKDSNRTPWRHAQEAAAASSEP